MAVDTLVEAGHTALSGVARVLVHAGKLIAGGIDPVAACRGAVAQAVTDDADMLAAIQALSSSIF